MLQALRPFLGTGIQIVVVFRGSTTVMAMMLVILSVAVLSAASITLV